MAGESGKSEEMLQAEFEAAFSEGAPPGDASLENEALGVEMPDSAVAAAGQDDGDAATADGGTPAVAADTTTDIDQSGTDAEENIQAGAGDAATADAEGDEPNKDPALELQRLRSWEGRLKKMAKDLEAKNASAKSAAPAAVEGAAADAVEDLSGADNAEAVAAAEEVAAQVEAGTMTPEQAMEQLTEDFGEGFVKMIQAIAASTATAAGTSAVKAEVDKVSNEVKNIISHIADKDEREHFTRITQVVPDFYDVTKTPEFDAFIQGGDEERKRVAAGGNAAEVIAMLKEFKAQAAAAPGKDDAAAAADPAKVKPAAAEVDESALDAAEGVRSRGGMSLPAEPKDSNDFEGAWEEAAKSV